MPEDHTFAEGPFDTYRLAGDPCPTCQQPMIERPGSFALTEVGAMPGIVCVSCNALYTSKVFAEAVRARTVRNSAALFMGRTFDTLPPLRHAGDLPSAATSKES